MSTITPRKKSWLYLCRAARADIPEPLCRVPADRLSAHPVPETADDFEELSGLGWALVQAHLLREVPRRGLAGYNGRGDHAVEAVRYAPADEAVAINKAQSFRPVPLPVWEFRIGGYQVIDK